MASIRARINSNKSLLKYCEDLVDFFVEHKYINATASDKRSLDQNAAIRECYKQILANSEGWTAIDVERHCKLNYGVPIRRNACEIENYVYGELFKKLDYEQRLKIMDMFAVTSKMSTQEGKDMIQAIMNDHPYIVLDKSKG